MALSKLDWTSGITFMFTIGVLRFCPIASIAITRLPIGSVASKFLDLAAFSRSWVIWSCCQIAVLKMSDPKSTEPAMLHLTIVLLRFLLTLRPTNWVSIWFSQLSSELSTFFNRSRRGLAFHRNLAFCWLCHSSAAGVNRRCRSKLSCSFRFHSRSFCHPRTSASWAGST